MVYPLPLPGEDDDDDDNGGGDDDDDDDDENSIIFCYSGSGVGGDGVRSE